MTVPAYAFLGKGGTGKSAIAGTTARLLARRGHDVLALDADHVPGLAGAIGLSSRDTHMLADAATIDDQGRVTVIDDLAAAVDRLARTGPDGVRFLQSGKSVGPMTHDQRASSTAFRTLVEHPPPDQTVLVDLSAGTRQAYFGWVGGSDTFVTIVTPSQKAVFAVRRLVPLVEHLGDRRHLLVLNDVADDRESAVTSEALQRYGLEVHARIPRDPTVREAARRGVAPIDHDAGSPFVLAVTGLVDQLTAHGASGSTVVA